MRLEARPQPPLAWTVLAPVGAVGVALLLCAVLVAASGAPVLPAYGVLVKGALGSWFAISETLTRATPLIFTGLAAAVAFRARLWNIGGEGQLYAGAIAATVLGTGLIDAPSWVLVPLLLAAGALAGAVLLLGPALLKLRFGVDEVVTTLLLNFVVLLLVVLLLEGPLKDPNAFGWPQAAPIVDAGVLPRLVPGKRLHAGLLVALAMAVLVWFIEGRTTLGYVIRAVGLNARAAGYAGIPVGRVVLVVALLSGGLAGLCGVSEVAGLKGNLTRDLSPGFGYTGIVVAMLAGLHPLGVVLAAIFVAGIFVGADAMSRAVHVSSYIADVIVATSLLTLLVAMLLVRFRLRRG
jgi:simple sugar transport system permease protein